MRNEAFFRSNVLHHINQQFILPGFKAPLGVWGKNAFDSRLYFHFLVYGATPLVVWWSDLNMAPSLKSNQVKTVTKTISLALAVCLIFVACGTYPCGKASSSMALVGYTDVESEAIILRRFSKGSNFVTLQDSITINRSNSNFQRQGDTLLILHSIDSYHDITSSYDYEIFIPAEPKTYRITEVVEDIQYGKKYGPKIYCINPITSYKLNGQFVGTTNYNFVYLRK